MVGVMHGGGCVVLAIWYIIYYSRKHHSVTLCYFVLLAVSKGSLVLKNTPSVLHKTCVREHL